MVVSAVAKEEAVAVATAAEDAKAEKEEAVVVEDVKVEIAVAVSGISLEEAVKTEVQQVADVKAETLEAAATEDADLNQQLIDKKTP